MLSEPEWLTFDEVIELNRLAVHDSSEPHGFIDRGVAEGALDRCRNRYLYGEQGDVITFACILMMSFSRSQGFRQGNKRTGFLAAQMFLNANGYILDMPDLEWFADMIITAVKNHRLDDAIQAVLRAYSHPI